MPALENLCNKYNITLTKKDIKYLLYTTPKELLKRINSDMPEQLQNAFISEFKWAEIESVKKNGRLFEQIEEMLKCLYTDGIEMAICGMGSKEYIEAVVDRCNIRKYFKYIYHRIDGRNKTQALTELLKEANASPSECIMVGDSITDITAAKGNNLPFIGVSYGYGSEDLLDAIGIADNAIQLKQLIYKQRIYSRIEQDISTYQNTIVIGINGVDTSGKTFFSKELDCFLRSRGYHTQVVHLDDFHNERAIRQRNDSPQGYIEYAFDLSKLVDLIQAMKKHPSEISMELLDLDRDTFTKKVRYATDNNTIIILEGVMLYRPPVDEFIDYRIYLDITFDEVLNRAQKRDVPIYGEEFLEKYINKYIPAQKMYIQQYRPKERSQLVIDNNDIETPYIK